MPVIRGDVLEASVTDAQRRALAEQLARELAGEVTDHGPTIFEITHHNTGKMDLLVVWDDWKPLGSEDRSDVILQAYKGDGEKIAQVLGVTYQEALEQQVLPYSVLPMVRRGDADEEDVKQLMIAEGGFSLPNGKVDLRFATMSLAERAHRRLSDRLPKGYWSIVQNVAPIA